MIDYDQMKNACRDMSNEANFDYAGPYRTDQTSLERNHDFSRTTFSERARIMAEMKRRGLAHLIVPDEVPNDLRSAERIQLHIK